jgi:hypothetical protein
MNFISDKLAWVYDVPVQVFGFDHHIQPGAKKKLANFEFDSNSSIYKTVDTEKFQTPYRSLSPVKGTYDIFPIGSWDPRNRGRSPIKKTYASRSRSSINRWIDDLYGQLVTPTQTREKSYSPKQSVWELTPQGIYVPRALHSVSPLRNEFSPLTTRQRYYNPTLSYKSSMFQPRKRQKYS